MRLDNLPDSNEVEDRRGQGGGFGMPGGGGTGFGGGSGGIGGGLGMLLPFLFRTLGLKGIILLVVAYFALRMFTGIDLLNIVNGGGGGIQMPDVVTQLNPGQETNAPTATPNASGQVAATDSGRVLVGKVLGSTEVVWDQIFKGMGKEYAKPKLVIFENFVQSACGTAQSAMGPFYCPGDQKVYIDLAFYQDMKTKMGAPGDFAQAYVVAHEVGHHVQTLLGIAGQVDAARRRASEAEGNLLSVKMELQADCFSGIWASEANATSQMLESGDIEEALNAASQIGDDKLQKASRGYVVPESFTHGSSAQRVRWFKQGMAAKSLNDCDTFSSSNL